MHLRSFLVHFGFRVNMSLLCHSMAARGIAQRSGVGKEKDLTMRTLWLQKIVKDRELQMKSATSNENEADLGTKVLLKRECENCQELVDSVTPGEARPDSF